MATRAEQLEKARQAKAAIQEGTTDAFVAKSKLDKLETGTLTPPTSSTSPAAGAFASLASLRPNRDIGMDDDDEGVSSEQVVAQHPSPATPGTPKSAQSSSPQPAPGAATTGTTGKAAFSSLMQLSQQRRSLGMGDSPASPSVYSGTSAQASPSKSTTSTQSDPPWGNPALPAGSHYTQAEWDAARAGGGFHVFEVRSGSEGALVRAPMAKVERMHPTVANGKIVHSAVQAHALASVSPDYMTPTEGLLLDGCLLLGPKAPTTHPRAASGLITVNMSDGKTMQDWPYRIVRPESQRERLGWLFSVKGALPFAAPPLLPAEKSTLPLENQPAFATPPDEVSIAASSLHHDAHAILEVDQQGFVGGEPAEGRAGNCERERG